MKTLISATFNDQPVGPAVPDNFARDVGDVSTWAPGYKDMSVVPDGSGGSAMRVTLEKGTIQSKPDGPHGVVLFIHLPEQVDDACMSYRIRFDSNFDWSMGGKLPGLSGVAPGVSPGAPSGGHPTDEGWSGRLMWLGADAYSWARPTNGVVSYMYHPGQQSIYGDNVQWNRSFIAGQWHTVKQCYRMNSVGNRDGQLIAWFDGQMVVNESNFVFRTRNDVHINYFDWDVFRGGATMDWAGDRTGYVDIDDLLVTTPR